MILAYHRINPWYPEDALTVQPENFERQMKYLLKKFKSVSPADYISGGLEDFPGSMLVTFDDGYADNLWYAMPVLKKLGIRPVIFLTVNYTGKKEIFKRYKNAERDRFLDWGEVKEMSSEGVVFGSHSLSHPHLPQMDDKSLRAEVEDSKKAIEDATGGEAFLFCYPYGDFNERVVAAVEKAGYSGAVVTPGMKRKIRAGRYTMPRTGVYGHNGFMAFKMKIWKSYLKEKYF